MNADTRDKVGAIYTAFTIGGRLDAVLQQVIQIREEIDKAGLKSDNLDYRAEMMNALTALTRVKVHIEHKGETVLYDLAAESEGNADDR